MEDDTELRKYALAKALETPYLPGAVSSGNLVQATAEDVVARAGAYLQFLKATTPSGG